MSITESVKARKKEMNFAESVHQLVTALSAQDPTMIRWTSDGAAFIVNPSHPGLGDALSKYFQHSKYSSFQRQLNQYGWTKPRSGRYNGTFFNPSFRRDADMEQVRKIARGGCKKHLRTVNVESENMTPLRKSRSSSSKKKNNNKTTSTKEDPSTPSPYRRRPRLPLQKRPVNFSVAKTVSPLTTTKSIEMNPSPDDMTAVQVLLGMIQKPTSSSSTTTTTAKATEESTSSRPPLSSEDNTSIVSSSLDPAAAKSSRSSRTKGKNFALAVHELVTEADATNPNMIRWVQDGSAFEIDPSHPNLGEALAKYFQHSKFSSFQRQLNQYGWCKLRNTGKFFNQNFHQDKEKSNFDLIQRKDKKTDASLSSSIRGSSRGTKRASIMDVSLSSRTTTNNNNIVNNNNNNNKRRRRMSSISAEPRLQPVSDEDTISSEEGSITLLSQQHAHHHVSFVDLTRPPSNVTAYLPHSH